VRLLVVLGSEFRVSNYPVWASAVMAALHLRDPQTAPLHNLNDADWQKALDFSDRSRLTLALRNRAREAMPEWVRVRADRNATQNRVRLEILRGVYRSLAGMLAPIEFLVLKGISQTILSGENPEDRVQYDVDLYAPRESALAARDILVARGYEPLTEFEGFPTDHLPTLILKTGWEWRGDFFDLEIPTPVELHFRFWDCQTERLEASGVEEFWNRRVRREIAGVEMTVLDPVDAVGYTALHVLRHVLRGNATPSHVYELALMLEGPAKADAFWAGWHNQHFPELRRLEAVAFQLAAEWFGCDAGLAAREEIGRLPARVAAWFKGFGLSPLLQQFEPNKDELWLHLALVDPPDGRWNLVRRRLLPAKLPGPMDAVYVPPKEMTWRRRWLKRTRYWLYVMGRAWHHASSLPRTLSRGALWALSVKRTARLRCRENPLVQQERRVNTAKY
jgi:hypothetical protein